METDVVPAAAQEIDWERVWSNFTILMGDSLLDIGAFFFWLVLGIIIWGFVFFLLGSVAGLVSYVQLRRRKCFHLDAKWYRYVAWIWAVLFIVSFGLGFGYGGLWFGGGRCVKHYITERRALDKIVVNLYCAIALDLADEELQEGDRLEKYQDVLADSQALSEAAEEDFEEMVREVTAEQADSWCERMLAGLAAKVVNDNADDLAKEEGIDFRVLILLAQDPDAVDEHLQEHPDGSVALALVAGHFETMRDKAVSLVNAFVYPNIATGVLVGIAIPAVLLGLFRLIVWLVLRMRPREPEPQEAEPDESAGGDEPVEMGA